MVNNLDIIKPHMTYLNERSFYFIQILKRKKENPEMKAYSIPVESFYIFDNEQLDRVLPHIIEKCEQNRARAYIKMNCLDAQSVALETISVLTQEIRKENWKGLSKSFNSACGICGKQAGNDKLYLIDLDNIEIDSPNYKKICDFINLECEPIAKQNKVYMSVPTRHGCHILTTGFDMKKFKDTYKDVDIHDDGITLLYFPKCCE